MDPPSSILDESELCRECNSVSRLQNGLCLNCLLLGAVADNDVALESESFEQALKYTETSDEDWCIGEHKILGEIARGGMGVIYRAREPHSGRIVALKCIVAYRAESKQALARFRREAETVSRLDHPNIVPIYHVGETEDGSPFFTMKYAANGSLLHIGRLGVRESVALMAKVARAIQYSHEQGILHRDLKPGNILIDGRGEPLVSDFGLARCDNYGDLTRTLTSFGTPGYIAPEQADGHATKVTFAADIYSLGAVLFELLAGRPPFVGENAFSVMKQSSERPAPRLRTLVPHLDCDLETICARCLEREPPARYQSTAILAQDLQNWLESRPITVRPIGLWHRSRQWVRTNTSSTILLAAFLVLTVSLASWQYHAGQLRAFLTESVLASQSVLVLPTLNLDTVTVDPMLSESLSQSLHGQLQKLGPVRISTAPAVSSVEWCKPDAVRKTGQETKTRAVLMSTLRKTQSKTHVSFRLVDTVSGDQMFGQTVIKNGQNATELVTEDVSRALYAILSTKDWSSALKAKLDPGLRNDMAKEAITAGRSMALLSASDCDKAITLFKKALQLEPNSSVAHAYLAMTAADRVHFVPDQSFVRLGEEEALTATKLSPGSSDAHRAMAAVYYQEGKYAEALEEQLRTIETGGLEHKIGSFIGLTLDVLGRPDQALKWYALVSKTAAALGEVDALVGDCWVRLNDDHEAAKFYNRAAELRPDSVRGLLGISRMHLLQGNFLDARNVCMSNNEERQYPDDTDRLAAQIEFFARNFSVAERLYHELETSDVDAGGSFYGAVTYQSALGRIKQVIGDAEEANAILRNSLAKEVATLERETGNPEAAYRVAAVEACLGLIDSSFRHLRQAVALGWIDYRSLKLDPRFDSLRSDPQLDAIIEEVWEKVARMRATLEVDR